MTGWRVLFIFDSVFSCCENMIFITSADTMPRRFTTLSAAGLEIELFAAQLTGRVQDVPLLHLQIAVDKLGGRLIDRCPECF